MMKSRGSSSYQSIVDRSSSESKIIKVYRNGDLNFPGRPYVLNNRIRTLDILKDHVNETVTKCPAAIRNIYTPNTGTRIHQLTDIKSDQQYVFSDKGSFTRIDYNAIQAHSPRRSKRHNRVDFTPPVTHSNQYQHVPSRFNQYGTGKWINCKINGYDKRIHVRLGPSQLQDMDKIHREVGETLIRHADESFFPLVSYDNKLFDSKGTEIIRVDQLLNSNEDDYTIFVRQRRHWMEDRSRPNEKEKPFSIPTHSPRSHPPYLWQQSKDKEPRPRTLPPIGTKNSPDNSVRSFPDSNRKRNQVNGVPIRAAKHTKKTTKQADYDKDDGGVFKAKNQNRDTRGAREVRDTNDTKVDLPIDQVPAQEVKDEKIKKEKQGKDNNGRPPRQADHSHSRTVQNGDRSQGVNNAQSKTGMQNGKNSTSKSNSKTAPDQSQAKSNVKTSNSKTEVKKENPPAKENKNHNNHDAVRSSTPKDNKTAPPPQSTPSPMKDNSAEENKAATKIQANYRGHQARKEVTDLKKKKDTDEKKQREAALKAKQDKEESEAATKIQATFRGHQARKEVNNKKQVRDVRNSKEDAAATKIQAGYRGHSARKEIDAKKNKRTEKNAEEEAAATKIQAGFRGHKARKDVSEKKQARDNLQKEEDKAATKIQAGFRGHQARKEVEHKRKAKDKQDEEDWAATKIQAGFRGHQARKDVQKKKTKRLDEKVDAVTFIQAAARGYLVRRRIQKRESTKMLLRLRSAAQEEVMDILGLIHERDRAATTIQANYRGYRDRKEYKHVKVKKRKKESATLLQANIRAFLARKDINKRLLVEMRKIDTPANRQNYSDSIDKVQASFHGYLFRRVATEKLHQILIRKDNITVVQASVRAYIDRWHIRRRQLADLARYHNAASEIQLSFKSFLARRNIGQDADKRNSSASKIQAGVRGYLARKGYLHTKRAATRIQSGYRGYKARQQYDHLARERQNSAAIVIQSRYRGYRVRNDIRIHTRQHALAQLLASARGFISREDISLSLNNMKEIEIRRAAIKIQSNYRGYAARHQYELRKRHHKNDIQKRKSITEIQAHFHGYLTRKRIEIRSRVHLNRFKSKDNSPMFLEGSLRFDLQTTGSISPIRPRTGRLRASLSNVSREQTYVIGGKFKNTNDDNLRQMAQSSSAHVDSFSHLQESFRSLLSSRRKSSKTPQQMFHESTRLKAVAHIQACFKGLLTRRLISQKYQYDKGQSQNPNPNLLTEIPYPAPQIIANPNEINLNGSYENPSSHISVNDHNVDSVPPEVSYHRQYSDAELAGRNGDDQTSDNVKTPVQYILRNNSKVDINEVRHSTPVDDSIPVQYLYRSRESTRHQYSSQTFRKMDLSRYEEPSPIQACETQISNPVLTDRSRFEEPSPLIPSRESPIVGNSGQSVNDEVSMNTTRDRFEEPSPIPNNQTLISDMKNHDQSNSDDSINVNKHVRRYEEPSPLISHSGSPILGDTSQRVHDEISVKKNTADAITERYEEPSIIPLKHTAIGDLKSFDQSNYDTNHKFKEPSPQIQNSEIYRDSICPVKDEISPEEKAVENHGERYEEPLSIENSQTTARDIQNWNNSNYDKTRRFEEPSPLPINADASRTENPASPRETVRELPSHDRFMQNPSRITPISTDSEVSVETFSRKLINEVQSSVLLKDEALLILQAAFQGFLIRNRSHSQRLKKMFKMNLNDRTIFEETAVPFLQAGVKGYLAQNRDAPSPSEM